MTTVVAITTEAVMNAILSGSFGLYGVSVVLLVE